MQQVQAILLSSIQGEINQKSETSKGMRTPKNQNPIERVRL